MCHEHMWDVISRPIPRRLHVFQCWPNHTSIFYMYTAPYTHLYILIWTINHKWFGKLLATAAEAAAAVSFECTRSFGLIINKSNMCTFQQNHSFWTFVDRILHTKEMHKKICKKKKMNNESRSWIKTFNVDTFSKQLILCLHSL